MEFEALQALGPLAMAGITFGAKKLLGGSKPQSSGGGSKGGVFNSLLDLRAKRIMEQKALSALQDANQEKPDEVNNQVLSLRRRLQSEREAVNGTREREVS